MISASEKNIEQDKGNWKCQESGGRVAILNMEVRGGITEKVIFEQILEEGERVSYADN